MSNEMRRRQCMACINSGWLVDGRVSLRASPHTSLEPCPDCNGTGWLPCDKPQGRDKTVQAKHLPWLDILRFIDIPVGTPKRERAMEDLQARFPPNIVWYKIERAFERGLSDYGTSIRTSFLTPKGVAEKLRLFIAGLDPNPAPFIALLKAQKRATNDEMLQWTDARRSDGE